ncbi:hypothetical protein VNO77_04436 [Canavalia gladiata]|uniref:Uncharacterized protein n=1 Tax=Canavalia gladiata TaxID=3824 RepID=A0AAN9MXC1_CANGL
MVCTALKLKYWHLTNDFEGFANYWRLANWHGKEFQHYKDGFHLVLDHQNRTPIELISNKEVGGSLQFHMLFTAAGSFGDLHVSRFSLRKGPSSVSLMAAGFSAAIGSCF